MAKVYEAMLLAQEIVPEATKQFLTDYNFSEAMSDPNANEQDPLDLAELGLAAPPLPQTSSPVATTVAVAEAIAASVATLASSFNPAASPPPTLPSKVAMPPPTQSLVPEAYRAEFRQLGEIVTRTAAQRTLKAVVVCGVEPNDHADFVAENLSLALAENSALRIAHFNLVAPATVVVQPQATESFRLKIQRTDISNLCKVVPLHGALPLAQLLRECDIEQMIEMLKQRFDFVLLETDAVNFADEVATFAGQADGVILVAQKSNMRGPAMSFAREKLQTAGAKILGAVLNRNREREQLQRVA